MPAEGAHVGRHAEGASANGRRRRDPRDAPAPITSQGGGDGGGGAAVVAAWREDGVASGAAMAV